MLLILQQHKQSTKVCCTIWICSGLWQEAQHPISTMYSMIMWYVLWVYAVCHSLIMSKYISQINNLCIIVMFTKTWSSIWTKYEPCGTFAAETSLWIYTGPMLARVAYAFVYVWNRNSGYTILSWEGVTLNEVLDWRWDLFISLTYNL